MNDDEFHLTPDALLPKVEYSEAELLAIDRGIQIAKQNGAYDRLRDAATFRHELNYGSGR